MIRMSARHLGALLVPTLLLGVVVAAPAQESPIKIGVVDVESIVAQSKAGRELVTRLDQFRNQVQQELKAGAERVSSLRAQAATASDPAEAARLAKQYEDEAIALQRKRDDKQREGQKMQEVGLRDIEKQLGPIFLKLRDEEGYDLILAKTPGVLLVATPRVDITEAVLERYNAMVDGG